MRGAWKTARLPSGETAFEWLCANLLAAGGQYTHQAAAEHLSRELGLRLTMATVRLAWRDHGGRARDEIALRGRPKAGTVPVIEGLTADDTPIDPEEVLARAIALEERAISHAQRGARQRIAFESGPQGFALLSDQHMGGAAAYREMFADARRVVDAGVHTILLGDFTNNWRAASPLAHLQAGEWFSDEEAKALFRHYLDTLRPSLVCAVAGNHDAWSMKTGGDYVRDALRGVACLYDPYEVRFALKVGEAEKTVVVRHKFRGRSMYNPTHAIEQACRMGERFDVGIQGDTHTATIARPFTVGDGVLRLAFLVSCYKIHDPFPRQLGLPPTQGTGSALLVVEEDGAMHGFSDMEEGLRHLDRARGL